MGDQSTARNEVNQPKFLTRTPLPALDWSTFFDAVNQVFELHLQSFGPPGQKKPVLVAAYPKTNEGNPDTSFDVILFHVVSSEMAPTDNTGRRVPKGLSTREVKPHPSKERYSIATFAWWEMMTVRFTVISLSRDRADEVLNWFHRMMMRYIHILGFFKARGVHDMRYAGRGEDKFDRTYGQELYQRTVSYTARIELLENLEVKDLESIAVQAGNNPQTEFTLEQKYPIPKP